MQKDEDTFRDNMIDALKRTGISHRFVLQNTFDRKHTQNHKNVKLYGQNFRNSAKFICSFAHPKGQAREITKIRATIGAQIYLKIDP